jgi:hypothetical protein
VSGWVGFWVLEKKRKEKKRKKKITTTTGWNLPSMDEHHLISY